MSEKIIVGAREIKYKPIGRELLTVGNVRFGQYATMVDDETGDKFVFLPTEVNSDTAVNGVPAFKIEVDGLVQFRSEVVLVPKETKLRLTALSAFSEIDICYKLKPRQDLTNIEAKSDPQETKDNLYGFGGMTSRAKK